MSPTTEQLEALRAGDRVIVLGGFRTEAPLEVVIESIDIEGDATVFDYTDAEGSFRWAYMTQITRIVSQVQEAA